MECVVVSNTLGTEVWGTYIGGFLAVGTWVLAAWLFARHMDE